MSYLTTADVQLRLRNTYDDVYYSADEEAVDTDLVDQDIASAEGIVDGYVAIRYITPVEELAYTARATGELPAGLEKRIERVYAALERVASGELTLGATPAPAENTDVADSLIIDGDDPMMTKDGMAGL